MGKMLEQEPAGPLEAPAGADSTAAGLSVPLSEESRQAGAAWDNAHAVNIRLSVPSPFGRFYLTLVAGRERRGLGRRTEERRKHPLIKIGNLCFLVLLSTIAGLAIHGAMQLVVLRVLDQSGFLVTP